MLDLGSQDENLMLNSGNKAVEPQCKFRQKSTYYSGNLHFTERTGVFFIELIAPFDLRLL